MNVRWGSATIDAALKLITLVPLALVIYYSDAPAWTQEFVSGRLLGFLVVGLTLAAYGIFLKRRIIAVYLDNPQSSSLGLGAVIVASSFSLYVVGSLYLFRSTLHLQSLLLLVLGYLAIRFDKRILRQMAPLLFIIGLSLVPPLLYSVIGRSLSEVYVSLLMLGAFAFYVEINKFCLIIPALILSLEQVYWFMSGAGFAVFYVIPLIPIYVLAMALLRRTRNRIDLRGKDIAPRCTTHAPNDESGFCPTCGYKIRNSGRRISPSFLGLLIVFIMIAVIFFVQVPALSLNVNGAPTITTYSYSGATSEYFMPTPSGWLVNSSTELQIPGDSYASQMVYVPAYHPEESNYTVISAVGFSGLQDVPGTGGDLLGWNITMHSSLVLGQFVGDLTGYQNAQGFIINFVGHTNAYFLTPGNNFEVLPVYLSFSRQFESTSLASASSTFVYDLNSVFLPSLGSQAYYGSWSQFLMKVSNSAGFLGPYFLALLTVGTFAWAVYNVKLSEYQKDELLGVASDLGNSDWQLFSAVWKAFPKQARTTTEIERRFLIEDSITNETSKNLLEALGRLSRKQLLKRQLSERGPEILLTWKVV